MDTINTIQRFLINNGWKLEETGYDYKSYYKQGNIGIDFCDDEIVLIGEEGDFLHIKINNMTLYYMLGYLLHNKYIAIDYKWI